jgi:hypothetical protein
MRDSERAAWTAYVRKREAEKKAKRSRARKLQPSRAEFEAALDDLAAEHQSRRRKAPTRGAGR